MKSDQTEAILEEFGYRRDVDSDKLAHAYVSEYCRAPVAVIGGDVYIRIVTGRLAETSRRLAAGKMREAKELAVAFEPGENP